MLYSLSCRLTCVGTAMHAIYPLTFLLYHLCPFYLLFTSSLKFHKCGRLTIQWPDLCDSLPPLSSYPDWYADALKPNFPCEHWPSKFDAPDIPPEMTQATTEEATTQTIIQETTEPSTQPTWPSASTYSSTRDETPSTIGNAATSNSLSLGGLLVLTSLTAVTLLHHL